MYEFDYSANVYVMLMLMISALLQIIEITISCKLLQNKAAFTATSDNMSVRQAEKSC